jgi:hypothetical protein
VLVKRRLLECVRCVKRRLDERSGRLLSIRTPWIILERVVCLGRIITRGAGSPDENHP